VVRHTLPRAGPFRAALIWTEIPEIMEIPAARLDAATTVQGIP
jgi:hypothetical protein